MYKACKPLGGRSNLDYLTELPCGQCPVIQHCSEGGIISPSTCSYYSQWLSAGIEHHDQPAASTNPNSGSADDMLAW